MATAEQANPASHPVRVRYQLALPFGDTSSISTRSASASVHGTGTTVSPITRNIEPSDAPAAGASRDPVATQFSTAEAPHGRCPARYPWRAMRLALIQRKVDPSWFGWGSPAIELSGKQSIGHSPTRHAGDRAQRLAIDRHARPLHESSRRAACRCWANAQSEKSLGRIDTQSPFLGCLRHRPSCKRPARNQRRLARLEPRDGLARSFAAQRHLRHRGRRLGSASGSGRGVNNIARLVCTARHGPAPVPLRRMPNSG